MVVGRNVCMQVSEEDKDGIRYAWSWSSIWLWAAQHEHRQLHSSPLQDQQVLLIVSHLSNPLSELFVNQSTEKQTGTVSSSRLLSLPVGPETIRSPPSDSLWLHFLCRGLVSAEVIASGFGPKLGTTLCEPAPASSCVWCLWWNSVAPAAPAPWFCHLQGPPLMFAKQWMNGWIPRTGLLQSTQTFILNLGNVRKIGPSVSIYIRIARSHRT